MLGVVNTGRIASGGTPDKQLDMAGLAPGGPGATAVGGGQSVDRDFHRIRIDRWKRTREGLQGDFL